jgi:two-component system, cell cycle sensor histidine kinase and response regulator CckA
MDPLEGQEGAAGEPQRPPSEQLFRRFIEQLPVAAAMLDLDLRYIVCSRRWLTDYELTSDAVIGRTHYEVFPHMAERWRRIFQRSLKGAVQKCEEDGLPRANGTLDWMRWEIHPWRNEQNEVGGLILFTEVITARRRLEDQLRQSQKMHAIGQLAGGIAHEFNNMLTVISGYAQLLKAQLPPQSPGLESVSQILKAAARNADVTRQLLALSGQQILRPQVLPVNRLVHSSEGLLARLLGEQYKVKVHAAQDAGWVRVDPTQMQQVLLNLALNARDAMPNGGTLTMETRNRMVPTAEAQDEGLPHGSYVEMVVSDTGRGMSENELVHLFEPFYTTKESVRSVGLGLPVIYGIVEQSGGQIRVQSAEGKGTTFSIFLPRTSPEDTPAEIPLRFPGRASRETILLVEDEDDVRILAGHLLRQSGYEVLDARSPSEALDRFDHRAQDIRLLLADVVLPEMSGHQLALRLRERRADLRVIFMSGYGESEVPEADHLRAPFLSKPFDLTTLQTVVRQALD